ncbi:coiled-coil domain-containing protein 42 like-2 [Corythoichthys intestinalis]|uniref:coiled-coil domain-containing protein 42 like-2 n=1 Tax=Corythoichthys intestinalis TaxID=161448 RepID=UPI0025A59967|nr:coiled-coil domain-containing protein 42 like-2 [Corythoichthys intestinalis]XP_061798778.1 coiled-coil domain-containing protein 42 like-2-like [Nerophis lumbriciformis]
MMTNLLPFLADHERLRLKVEKKTRNIFITQPDDCRKREENVNYIAVVTEPPSRILGVGVNTLQKTLVLKKQAELDEVNNLLVLKRKEFMRNVDELAQMRTELQIKHQEVKHKALKFERFVNDNEAIRSQAVQQYKAMQEHNVMKQRELDELTKLLQQLRARKHILKERLSKYKIYEDFLMKTLDYLPDSHLETDSECAVMPILRRHETLCFTHQQLLQRLGRVEEEVERSRRQLHAMKRGHNMHKLMASKELHQLQWELESLREKNKQAENKLLKEQEQSRKKAEEVGSLILAINNLAEQCYLPAYGPLENMSASKRMDMVKEYLMDKTDTEKRLRKLMECASQTTSKTALTGMKVKASMSSFGNKMQLKSPSKVSKTSDQSS